MNAQEESQDSASEQRNAWSAPPRAQELLAQLKNRRSVRRFSAEETSEEQIAFLLEAARWAPTALQCWRFVAVQNESLLSTLIDLAPGILGRPSAVIVVCADMDVIRSTQIYPELALQETAMASQNILLAASALGLGGCFIGSFSKKGIAVALNLPSNLDIHNLIALGYPAETVTPPPRKPIAEILIRSRS